MLPRWSILLFAVACFSQEAYQEPYRPQFHFSPKVNWTNDPNGLVYLDGTYHLFFQFNPFGDVWGHMSWGHATSRDLLHWQQQPVALPEENGVMIFTGSTVVDTNNTSGFCVGSHPCLVAVYTGHTMETKQKAALQTQNLAYSTDGGIHWTKYSGNPVLDLHMADFRDPKVFWSAAGKQWIMVVSLPNDHKAQFYGSPDLKRWSELSQFGPSGATGGQWECPELFELPLDGRDSGKTRWVLKVGLNPGGLQGGSGEQYFVGQFDGKKFLNDNDPALTLWTDYGKDCYCALTFNHLPPDQPQVMIGWMNNWQYANVVPTQPWRGQMTFPRELSLKTYPEGIRLVQQPIAAIENLREKPVNAEGAVSGQVLELVSTTDLGTATEAGWRVLADDGTYTLIGYDAKAKQIFVDRTKSGNVSFSDKFPARTTAPFDAGSQLKLHVLLDRMSVEVFAGDGQVALTNLVFPTQDATKLDFYSIPVPIQKTSSTVWKIRSIW